MIQWKSNLSLNCKQLIIDVKCEKLTDRSEQLLQAMFIWTEIEVCTCFFRFKMLKDEVIIVWFLCQFSSASKAFKCMNKARSYCSVCETIFTRFQQSLLSEANRDTRTLSGTPSLHVLSLSHTHLYCRASTKPPNIPGLAACVILIWVEHLYTRMCCFCVHAYCICTSVARIYNKGMEVKLRLFLRWVTSASSLLT